MIKQMSFVNNDWQDIYCPYLIVGTMNSATVSAFIVGIFSPVFKTNIHRIKTEISKYLF